MPVTLWAHIIISQPIKVWIEANQTEVEPILLWCSAHVMSIDMPDTTPQMLWLKALTTYKIRPLTRSFARWIETHWWEEDPRIFYTPEHVKRGKKERKLLRGQFWPIIHSSPPAQERNFRAFPPTSNYSWRLQECQTIYHHHHLRPRSSSRSPNLR